MKLAELNSNSKFNNRLLALVPALLVLCSFSNTLSNGFVYDDRFQIVEAGPVLQDWRAENLAHVFDRDIWAFFCQNLSWQSKVRTAYYRPIFALFVMINYRFAGLNPQWWHLAAMTLHLIATLLAFQLLLASLQSIDISQRDSSITTDRSRWLALLATICFAIHPAQSESVAWVSAYVNPLSAITIFTTLICYLRARKGNRQMIIWLMAAAFSFALAMLTKESAIITPAIIAAYEIFIIGRRDHNTIAKRLLYFAPFLVITIGYLLLRIAIFGAIRPPSINPDFPQLGRLPLLTNIFLLPMMLIKYIKILIWPFSLNPMYDVGISIAPSLVNFILPIAALLLLSAAALILARNDKTIRLALIWLLMPLLPVLDVRSFKLEDFVHDRYLYISILGFGLLLADGLYRLNARLSKDSQPIKPSLVIVSLAILCAVMATTIKQNRVWADEWQLWSAAQDSVPASCTVNMELGRLNDEAQQDNEAKNYYLRALETCPDSLTVYYNLGMLYGRAGDMANAQIAFEKLESLSTNSIIRATANFNLGLICEKRGALAEAIKHYQKGIALYPASKNAQEVRQTIEMLKTKLDNGSSHEK